jgi:capsular polysaccharide biosynthesis protein
MADNKTLRRLQHNFYKRSNFVGFPTVRPPVFSVSEGSPGITEHEDLVYIPTVNALYRLDGTIIPESRRIHFDQSMVAVKTSETFRKKMEGVYPSRVRVPKDLAIEDRPVVLLGNNTAHFGHFLLEGLARMWPILSGEVHPRNETILVTNSTPQASFAGKFFEPLGVLFADILSPSVPTLYRRVRVVAPSINHIFNINRQFAEVHRELAARMMSNRRFERPVFISRAGVANGIHVFHGEDVLEAEFVAKGFEAIRPETLSFPDQLSLFAKCPLIVGSIGSAFHSILFEPEHRNTVRVMMSPENVGHRFPMVDAVCRGHQSWYLNVMPAVTKRGQQVSINVDAAREMLRSIGVL